MIGALRIFAIVLMLAPLSFAATSVQAGEARPKWQEEWDQSREAAKKEGKVVVYFWQGGNLEKAILAFNKRYPDIPVNAVGESRLEFYPAYYQPAEPPASTYKSRVRQPAYPVEKLAGLLYAYLGPKPAPLLPRYDVLARNDGERRIVVLPALECNWLQPMENSVDPTHTHYLHGAGKGKPIHGDGRIEIAKYEFAVFEHGIMKKRYAGNGNGAVTLVNQHPLVFPNMLRQHHGREHYLQYRVAVDDTRTLFFEVYFLESKDGSFIEQREDPPVEYASYYKNDDGTYKMERVWMQDYMVWETAGAVFDRTKEHLASADKGIITFRKLFKAEVDKVKRGRDPLGVIRDPKKNQVVHFHTVTDSEREVGKSR